MARRRRPRGWSPLLVAVLALLLTTFVAPVAPAAPTPTPTAAASKPCAPLDLVLLLDTTGSMGPAIANVKKELAAFVATVDEASGGDYRLALVDFGLGVRILTPFGERNAAAVGEKIKGLSASGGGETREAWDEALATLVDNRTAAQVKALPDGRQTGDFATPWRAEAKKLVILVTDAGPAGFDDTFTEDDHAHMSATAQKAARAGIRVATFFVPNKNKDADAPGFLREVAELTNSTYVATLEDGTNLTAGLQLDVQTCALDSDGDGLFDVWEADGYDADGDGAVDVDLPGMGADPKHKDLFLQVNWMLPDGAVACWTPFWCPPSADGAHPPDQEALGRLVDALAQGPVSNPDGRPGIALHVDAGDRTPAKSGVPAKLREGGPIPIHADYLLTKADKEAALLTRMYDLGVPKVRRATLTWALYVHDISEGDTSLGLASAIPGDMFFVSKKQIGENTPLEAATLMHELGHTLGLHHGGYDDVHGKPNYLSVMNYDFAFDHGLTRGGQGGVLDYSRFDTAPLASSAGLDEGVGVTAASASTNTHNKDLPDYRVYYRCATTSRPKDTVQPKAGTATQPLDYTCDGDTKDTGVTGAVYDLSRSKETIKTLTSRDDWDTLTFTGGVRGGLASEGDSYSEGGFTGDDYRAAPKEYAVSLAGPGRVATSGDAGRTTLAFAVTNLGSLEDTYAVTATAAGWTTEAVTAREVTVASGAQRVIPVVVPVPVGSSGALRVTLRVQSTHAGWISANSEAELLLDGTPRAVEPTRPVTFEPAQPTAGRPLRAIADGFAPGTPVIASSQGGWFAPVSAEADAAGRVSVEVTTPTQPGTDAVTLVGLAAGASAGEPPLVARGDVTTLAPPGVDLGQVLPWLAGLAAVVLSVVVVVVVVLRRQ